MAGVPASGVGPGDLKSNSVVCERSVGAARSIDRVFFPSSGGMIRANPVCEELGAGHYSVIWPTWCSLGSSV